MLQPLVDSVQVSRISDLKNQMLSPALSLSSSVIIAAINSGFADLSIKSPFIF
jgi:hypothetical protein